MRLCSKGIRDIVCPNTELHCVVSLAPKLHPIFAKCCKICRPAILSAQTTLILSRRVCAGCTVVVQFGR